jgi:hypothetical protein
VSASAAVHLGRTPLLGFISVCDLIELCFQSRAVSSTDCDYCFIIVDYCFDVVLFADMVSAKRDRKSTRLNSSHNDV